MYIESCDLVGEFLCCSLNLCFFFFKQKTAYEMRISDWSSDVCSSDLARHVDFQGPAIDADAVAEIGAAQDVVAAEHVFGRDAARFAEIGRASCRERVCQYV